MTLVSSKKSEFQELFNTIRAICSGDISREDKKVLTDFLRTLRYTCEFDVLKKCYDQNAVLRTVIPDIDTKLIELGKHLDDLQNKVRVEGELSSFDEVKLKAYKTSYDRYNMIKEAITNRNFENYTEEMNKNLNSANQIIAACSSSLNDADLRFIKDFEIMGKKKNALEVASDIQSDPQLLTDLVNYYKKSKNLSKDCEDSLAKDQEYLRYLKLADENQSLLRKYMLTLRKCGNGTLENEVVCKERLTRNKLKLNSLDKGVVSSLRNRSLINGLNLLIEEDEETLETIKRSRENLEKLDKQIRAVGLGPIIDEFNYAYGDYTGSVEQRIVDFLKVSMRKNGLNVSRVEKNVEEEISSLNFAIGNKDNILHSSASKMSEYGRELINKYPDETMKIVEILTDKKKSKINPLLSAYVLKSLATVQNLSYEDINDIIKAYDGNGITNLVEKFEGVVQSTINSIENSLMEVISRPEFDVNALPDMRLK